MKYWYLKGEDLFGPAEAREILRDSDFTKDTLVCPEPHCEKQKFWKPAYRYNEDFNFSKEELHDIPQETENGFELEIEDLTKNPLYDSESVREETFREEAEKEEREERKGHAEDFFVKALSAREEPPAPKPVCEPEEEQNKLAQMLQADEDTLPTAVTRDFAQDYGGEISNKTKIFIRSELTNPKEMSQSEKNALDPKNIVLRLMGTVPSRVLDVPAAASAAAAAEQSPSVQKQSSEPEKESEVSEGTLFTPRPKTLGPVVVTPEKELITEVRSLKNKPEDTSSGLIKEGVIKEDDSFEEEEPEVYISKELRETPARAEDGARDEAQEEKKPEVPLPTFFDTEGVLVQGEGQDIKSSASSVSENTKTVPSTFSETVSAEDKSAEAFPMSLPKNAAQDEDDDAEEEIPHIFDNSSSDDGIFSVLGAKGQKQNQSFEDIDKEEKEEDVAPAAPSAAKKVSSTANAVPTINGKIISSFEGHSDVRRPKNDIIYILILFMALVMGVALFMTFVMQGGKTKKTYSYVTQKIQERQKTETLPQASAVLEGNNAASAAEPSEDKLETNKRSAQNIVKGIALEQEETSLVAYLDKKYEGYTTEWRADLLHDDTYIVEFVARRIRKEPVQYIFSVNLTDEKVQGDNTIARELLTKK